MEFRDLFNYGVPTGVLLLLLYALWRMILWGREEVAKPVVKSHLDLISTLQSAIPKIESWLGRIQGDTTEIKISNATTAEQVGNLPKEGCKAEIVAEALKEVTREAGMRVQLQAEAATVAAAKIEKKAEEIIKTVEGNHNNVS